MFDMVSFTAIQVLKQAVNRGILSIEIDEENDIVEFRQDVSTIDSKIKQLKENYKGLLDIEKELLVIDIENKCKGKGK